MHRDVFGLTQPLKIGEGKLKINIDKIYPLAEAGQAQADLEGRKTTGKLLLKP